MILIDAEALCTYANNNKEKTIDANDIMRFPIVDAVPVVRCKDCHWWQHKNNEISGLCRLTRKHSTGKWYCADGMREKKFEEYVDEVERRTIREIIIEAVAEREKKDGDTK